MRKGIVIGIVIACLLGAGYGAVSLLPGGTDTQIQFNDGGSALGGDAGLTYSKTTDTVSLAGPLFSTAPGNSVALDLVGGDDADTDGASIRWRNGPFETTLSCRDEGRCALRGDSGVFGLRETFAAEALGQTARAELDTDVGSTPDQAAGNLILTTQFATLRLNEDGVFSESVAKVQVSKLVVYDNELDLNEVIKIEKSGANGVIDTPLGNLTISATGGVATLTGNASTSTALAADGADCIGAGEFAKGVNASGVASGCAVPPGTYTLPAIGIATLGGVKGRAGTSLTCNGTDKATGFDTDGSLLCGGDAGGVDLSGEPLVTSAASGNLSGERVLSNGTNTTIDTGTVGQIKVNVSGLEPAGTFSGIGACGANTWASTLNDTAAPTCTQPAFSNLSGTAAVAQLPDATTGAKGIVQLAGDLNGTAAAPGVVDDSHAHTSSSISGLDMTNDVTAGVLAGARGGVGVALPTCGGTDKLTANGTQVSCATDQTGGAGSLDCVQERVWQAVADTVGLTGPTFSTAPCQTITNMTALANRGSLAVIDMDRYTHCKLLIRGGNTGAQTGTVTIQLRDYNASTNHGTVTWSNVACADRAYAVQDFTAKTGLVGFGVQIGDSVVTDDPQIAPISIICCNGTF